MNILNGKQDSGEMNKTFIVLIPKCKNPISPKEFRPINLCNMVMKIVSKAIANRVKIVLSDFIDVE